MLHHLHRVDARLGDHVRGVTRRVLPGDAVAIHTTDLGSMFMVVAASTVVAASGRRRLGLEMLTVGSAAWLVAQGVKDLLDRPRPYEAEDTPRLIPPPTGSSMPSGHAAVVAGVMTVAAADVEPGRRWLLGAMALWVPVTRVHLGVHYPSDTVVGLALGVGLGNVVRVVSRQLRAWVS